MIMMGITFGIIFPFGMVLGVSWNFTSAQSPPPDKTL